MNVACRKPLLVLGLLLSTTVAQAASVQVLSATVKDQAIAGATVIMQKNGATSVGTQSDAQGRAELSAGYPDDPNTLVLIKKDGYSTLVAKCPCQGMTYALSPIMHNLDGLRVVLTWGQYPADLDSHIVYPSNHIFFQAKRGTDANLDVDDTDSYGPETITLERKHTGETYVYAVHDYTHRASLRSQALGDSEAKVFVYVGQSLVRTYYVPMHKSGNLWTVFRINGNGDFEDINTVADVDMGNVPGAMSKYGDTNTHFEAVAAATVDTAQARTQNLAGEASYHAGRLNDAITAFQRAIDLDPNFGQAYSNLGLTYQKAGRSAEAIWADRKAIALANGPNAPTVRASSYFNIAKLYEDAGQYADALVNYRAAKREKANPVYDKAIERVSARQ